MFLFQFQLFIIHFGFLLYLRPILRRKEIPCDAEENGKNHTNGKNGHHFKLLPPPVMPEPEKWKNFALILDRIHFLIFVPTLIICFVVIFPFPERLFKL